MALGLAHAVSLRDTIRTTGGEPAQTAHAFHDITETELTPWYASQIRTDRNRYQTMDALRQGHTPPPPDGDEYSEHEALFWQTMPFDADLFRAAMEIMSALTLPRDIYTRPEIMNRAEAVAKQLPVDAPATPGTSRAELLAAINSSKV